MHSFLTASVMEETWISRMRLLLGHGREELALPPGDLLRGGILHVGGEAPAMAGGILHLAEAVAPEHVGHRHQRLGSGGDRSLERGVDVGDVEVERAGCRAG